MGYAFNIRHCSIKLKGCYIGLHAAGSGLYAISVKELTFYCFTFICTLLTSGKPATFESSHVASLVVSGFLWKAVFAVAVSVEKRNYGWRLSAAAAARKRN